MLVALLANLALRDIPPYNTVLIAHVAVYALALVGYVNVKLGVRSRFTYLFYYFVLLNYTCMIGCINYARGVRRPTWTPER